MTAIRPSLHAASLLALVARRGGGLRLGQRPARRAAGHAGARQVPLRQGHGGAQRQEVARRRASSSSRSSKPTRRAPIVRTPSSASATPTSARARPNRSSSRSTSSASSCRFYPTQPPRRLRAVQARHGALPADARARSATRPKRATPIKEFETFIERYPNSSLMPEVQRQAARGAGPAERGGLPGRPLLLPAAAGTRARSIASSRVLKDDPEFTSRDAVLLLPRRVARQGEAAGRSAPLSREARQASSRRASISTTRRSGSPS